jgi:hypothetical protein
MAAIARVLSSVFPATSLGVDVLKMGAQLFGAGLLVYLLLATYGLDTSAGFF